MNEIKQLSKEVISKVAAGEVVESPASVVKELIENAIDANATQIDIEVKDSGFEKIRVIDNGHGMTKENLEKSHLQHTTSKIFDTKDLESIRFMGFRGEALYTISSVSKTTIKSKTEETLSGHFIEIEGGNEKEIKPIGMPTGTEVCVHELFYNVPARKEFSKSKQLEFKSIIQIVENIALIFHNVGFTLKHNKKLVLHLPQNQTRQERINYILGESLAKNLLSISTKNEYSNIEGYISKPQGALTNNNTQYIYVNNRAVNIRGMSSLIKNTYGSLIDAKSHPAFVISINTPFEMVDVNIHPRKLEARLINAEEIRTLIHTAVAKALGLSDLTYKIGETKDSGAASDLNGLSDYGESDDEDMEFEEFLNSTDSYNFEKIENNKKSNEYLSNLLKESSPLWNIKTDSVKKEYDEILQVKNLYLITECRGGVLMVDQHAAHERILYEELLTEFKSASKSANNVIEVNKLIDLQNSKVQTLLDNKEILEKAGIGIEHFKSNTIKITSLPKVLKNHDLGILFDEIALDLENNGKIKDIDEKSIKTLSYIACRSAIKGGDYLTMDERKNLLKKLDNTKTNYTCPHGRPVMVEISLSELGKLFKRI